MDEVKNMLDYNVGHYVHQKDLTYEQSHNILRSFMFIKPDGTIDKRKDHLVTDGSSISLRPRLLNHGIPQVVSLLLIQHRIIL